MRFLDSGYTGHEHLQGVGLINMNARLYDPKLHRFLAPDNFIQEPSNSQNYNRYGYVWNNPLRYNDPSGEVVWAVAIGAAVGVIMNGINNSSHGQPFFQGVIKAAGIGGISGALSFGAGSAVLGIGGSVLQQAGTGILLHGASAGMMSGMSTGDFWSGFVVGGVSSGVASGIGATGISNQYWMAGAQIGGATIVGGASSVLAGGNFWDGARQGFITATLNHVAHAMIQKGQIKRPWDTNGDGKLQKSEADNWWLNGKGKSITVDNRLIDWSGLDLDEISAMKVGSSFAIETHEAFMNLEYETAATYGGTSFKKTGLYTIEVQDQKYHYNYRPNNSPKNIIRNIMTRIGEPVGQMPGTGDLYTGQDYMIHYENRTISVFDLR